MRSSVFGALVLSLATTGCGPQTLATISGPGSCGTLIVHGGVLYASGPDIYRVPASGGSPTTLALDAGTIFYVDDSFVYFYSLLPAAADAGVNLTQVSVSSVPVAGGAVVQLFPEISLDPDLSLATYRMATDGRTLYWLDEQGSVRAAPLGGGAAQILVSKPGGSGLVVGGGGLYLIGESVGEIDWLPLDGGAPVTIGRAVPRSSYASYTADEAGIYWALDGPSGDSTTCDGIVGGLVGDGGVVQLSGDQCLPGWGVAVDETNVYWSAQGAISHGGRGIFVVPRAGGLPRLLADAIGSIALDEGYVYFCATKTSRFAVALQRVPK